jgi:tetratricopeptide (TPR) repeat protein
LLGFSILGPLGLLGMVLSLRRWRECYFLLAFVLALMGSTIFFFVISRLRLHICSALLIFMAYALIWAWERIRAGEYRPLLQAAIGTAALAAFVNWPFSTLRPHEQMAQTYRFYALHLRNQDRLAEAAEEYERAIELDPQLADTYVDFAALRLAEDRREEAWELYQRALQIDPRVSGVHQHFGNLCAQMGSWDKAIAEFRAEIRASPYSFKAYESLYRALQEKSKGNAADDDSLDPPSIQN